MRWSMTETGIIREIQGNLLIIGPDRGIACFGCLNMECKADGGFITAENPEAFPLETGQMVELSAPGISLLGQALASLLPPVLGFIAGYAIARLLFPGAGEGAFAGAGVILLFACAFIVFRVRAKFPAKRIYTVLRVL